MSVWWWTLAMAAAGAAIYVALVIGLVVAGRHTQAWALARFVPDCAVLFRRLAADARVPRRYKLALVLLAAYLASPLDLVPDAIPVIGVLDDAVLVALTLRAVVRSAGAEAVRECWPGPEASLRAVLRVSGAPAPAVP
jgi:uncharacterized membrane protein YkvA (DUF1232 family)